MMKHLLTTTIIVVVATLGAATLGTTTAGGRVARAPVTSCENLASLALPNATITAAHRVDAGAFVQPVPEGGRPTSDAAVRTYGALPAFCRVTATLTPSTDSDIKMEVWMPAADWNGKLQVVGNGAFTGNIRYGSSRSLASGLGRGYATSATDTGHVGGSASFGLGHPEKVIDFGWRSVHETTVTAKRIIAAYYDDGPRFSYWNGCSAGGRQAMKEAPAFPRGLRRHHRRGARSRLDRPRGGGSARR